MPAAPAAWATRVRIDAVVHHDGQTFLTWTSSNGPGTTYWLYRSDLPISNSSDLAAATLVGYVGDSTWCDRRLSALTGTLYSYAVDSLASPLTPGQGLFVATPAVNGSSYYAVTVQGPGGTEEKTITAGWNTLGSPVIEHLATPRPVFQRALDIPPLGAVSIYTLWTSHQATSLFPAMSNRASLPYDCAVTPGGSPPQNSLMVIMHARGGNFMQGVYPTSHPGQWVLSLDDPVDTRELNTFWYGYHENYNLELWTNPAPTLGVVQDYTLRRVLHTLLWARRQFGVDTTRVYSFGISMGAIGGILAAWRAPGLFAAIMGIVPKFDFSFITDPLPSSLFNPGNVLRDNCDRLWGAVGTNLITGEGGPVFNELNAATYAAWIQPMWVPPLIAFSGRNDDVVGWAEKIPYYTAMRATRQGGAYFWDPRQHLDNAIASWVPMQDPEYLYRFRTNLSFPALSNGSADGNPGDGDPAVGDSIGTINGYVEWDTSLVDQPRRWQTTLRTRDLTTRWQTMPAPESVTVDVTPRRLQSLVVAADSAYSYTVARLPDSVVVQQGVVVADSLPLLTVPGVTVYRSGSVLRLTALGNYGGPTTAVGDPRVAPGRPAIALAPNPARGAVSLRLAWPRAEEARVALYDAAGRLVRSIFHGVPPPQQSLGIEREGLSAGLYFVVATQHGTRVVKRVAVLR
jgi:hypothetical protein